VECHNNLAGVYCPLEVPTSRNTPLADNVLLVFGSISGADQTRKPVL